MLKIKQVHTIKQNQTKEDTMAERTFTEQKNRKIYFACHRIRIAFFKDASLSNTPTAKKIVDYCKIYSSLYHDINQYKWEEIFKDKQFLEILLSATNMVVAEEHPESLKNALITIKHYFPKETKVFIPLEL